MKFKKKKKKMDQAIAQSPLHIAPPLYEKGTTHLFVVMDY